MTPELSRNSSVTFTAALTTILILAVAFAARAQMKNAYQLSFKGATVSAPIHPSQNSRQLRQVAAQLCGKPRAGGRSGEVSVAHKRVHAFSHPR